MDNTYEYLRANSKIGEVGLSKTFSLLYLQITDCRMTGFWRNFAIRKSGSSDPSGSTVDGGSASVY